MVAKSDGRGSSSESFSQALVSGHIHACDIRVDLLDNPCIIFSLFASSPPVVDASVPVVTQVWGYVGELIFNLLVLVGMVKMADRLIREMLFGG